MFIFSPELQSDHVHTQRSARTPDFSQHEDRQFE